MMLIRFRIIIVHCLVQLDSSGVKVMLYLNPHEKSAYSHTGPPLESYS